MTDDVPSAYEQYMARRYLGHVQQCRRYGREPLSKEQFLWREQQKAARRQERASTANSFEYATGTQEHGVLSVKAVNLLTKENESVTQHILDRIVQQEGGSRLRGNAWTTIGPGCYRKNKLYP